MPSLDRESRQSPAVINAVATRADRSSNSNTTSFLKRVSPPRTGLRSFRHADGCRTPGDVRHPHGAVHTAVGSLSKATTVGVSQAPLTVAAAGLRSRKVTAAAAIATATAPASTARCIPSMEADCAAARTGSPSSESNRQRRLGLIDDRGRHSRRVEAVGVRRTEQAAENRDAQRAAEFASQVVHRRTDALQGGGRLSVTAVVAGVIASPIPNQSGIRPLTSMRYGWSDRASTAPPGRGRTGVSRRHSKLAYRCARRAGAPAANSTSFRPSSRSSPAATDGLRDGRHAGPAAGRSSSRTRLAIRSSSSSRLCRRRRSRSAPDRRGCKTIPSAWHGVEPRTPKTRADGSSVRKSAASVRVGVPDDDPGPGGGPIRAMASLGTSAAAATRSSLRSHFWAVLRCERSAKGVRRGRRRSLRNPTAADRARR